MVAALPIVAYTEQTVMNMRASGRNCSRLAKTIRAYDLIVAATALGARQPVATFNKRHFALVKGRHIIEPR